MTQLPADQGITRFKENEERMDVWINDPAQAGHYHTNEQSPRTVESLPALTSRISSEAGQAISDFNGDGAQAISDFNDAGDLLISTLNEDLRERYLTGIIRGAWAQSTLYSVNDIAEYSGNLYICAVQHTSSSSFASDVANWGAYQTPVLQQDLANDTDPAKGAALIGFKDRTVYDELSDIVNVKQFGVIGDGVTNDTLAIQTALDSGKSLFFPDGDYLFDSVTMDTDNQCIFGSGKANIIPTDEENHIFTVSGDNQKFINLIFKGIATEQTTGLPFAIYTTTTPATNLTIKNCLFTGTDSSHGLGNCIKLTENCHGAIIDGNRFDSVWGNLDNGYMIIIGNSDNCVVVNNIMIGDALTKLRGRHGVYISSGTKYCIVKNNYIYGTYEAGVTHYSQNTQDPCEYNIISNNVIVDCSHSSNYYGAGITVGGKSRYCECENNIIINSGSKGICFDSTGYPIYPDITPVAVGNKIKNNSIYSSGHSAIEIINNDDFIISGNYCKNSSLNSSGVYSHIYLSNDNGTFGCSNGLISNNKCHPDAVTRSSLKINSAQISTNISCFNNIFPTCNLTDIEEGISTILLNNILKATKTWDVPSLTNGESTYTDITVTGAVVGDAVYVYLTTIPVKVFLYGIVSSANTVNISILNSTGSTLDISSGTLIVEVFKRN